MRGGSHPEPVKLQADPDLTEPHLSNRLLRGLLLFLEQRWDRDTADRLLTDAGLSRALAVDPDGWTSVHFQRRLNALIELEGRRRAGEGWSLDRLDFWRAQGRAGWRREALGPLHGLVRSFGSPRALYKSMPTVVPRGNLIIQVALLSDQAGETILALRAAPGFEPLSEALVLSFEGLLEAVPTVWGMPMARVSQEHLLRGGALDEVRYTASYVNAASDVPVFPLLFGVLTGIGLGTIAGLSWGVGGGSLVFALSLLWRARNVEQSLLQELRSTSEIFEASDARVAQLWTEQRELRRTLLASRKLSGYLAADLVERIIENPELELGLGGRRADAAVLFVDIVGFTPRCEAMTSEQVIEELNLYFSFVDPAFRDSRGIIDKRMGDGIMGVFVQRDGEDCEQVKTRAIRCGLAILAALTPCNMALAERGAKPMRVRVGIAWGPLVQGNIGSDFKLEYTVIGDTVNLAARLEGAADPDTVLVSDAGLPAELGALGRHRVGERRSIRVKGKSEPIPVVSLSL